MNKISEEEFLLENITEAYDLLKQGATNSTGIFIDYSSKTTLGKKRLSRINLSTGSFNNSPNIAVVGAGEFTKKVHLPNLKKLGKDITIKAIVNRTGSTAMQLARQYDAKYASTSFDDVLSDSEINSVLIGTRHNLHADMTLKALKAGKNVFVEKPLAMTGEELSLIEEFYKSNNDLKNAQAPILMVGFNRRFSPLMKKIKRQVTKRKNPLIMNYQMNAGYLSSNHWLRTEEGGGRNLGEACHIYDLFTYLTDSDILRVNASSIRSVSSDHADNENFTATLSFSDGSVCSLMFTSLGSNKYPKEIFHVYVDETVQILTDYRELESADASNKVVSLDNVEKGHFEELASFVDSIRNGVEWPIPFWHLIQASRIALIVEEQITGAGQ